MTQERPPAGGAAANGSPEVPHPAIGVRDLRVERLELAAGLTGPGADGVARRAAIVELVVGRLREQWEIATEGEDVSGIALGAVGSVGRGDASPVSDLDLLLVHEGRGHSPEELSGAGPEALVPHLGRGPGPRPLGPVARAVPPGRVQGPPGGGRAARPAAGLRRRRRHRPRQVRAARGLALGRPSTAAGAAGLDPAARRAPRRARLPHRAGAQGVPRRHPRRGRAERAGRHLAHRPPARRGRHGLRPPARRARHGPGGDAPAHQPAAARGPGRGRRARRLRRPRRPAGEHRRGGAGHLLRARHHGPQRAPGPAATGPHDACWSAVGAAPRACGPSPRTWSSTTARSCWPSRPARRRTRCSRCGPPRPPRGPGSACRPSRSPA